MDVDEGMNSEQPSENPRSGAAAKWIPMPFEALASQIIESAFRVHRHLGPGMLESAYESCLEWELVRMNLQVERQKLIPLKYHALVLPVAFRADIVVQDHAGHRLIAELKAVEALPAVTRAQLISYLRLLNLPLGLIINFNNALLKDGIERVLNRHWEPGPGGENRP